MPNRLPLRPRAAISVVDQPASPAERLFAAFAVSAMLLTSAIMALS